MAGLLQRWRGKKNGGQLGCNQQFGPWVVGIEGTLSGVSLKANLASLPAAYGWDVTTHIDTVLARISYKFGSVPLAAKY